MNLKASIAALDPSLSALQLLAQVWVE